MKLWLTSANSPLAGWTGKNGLREKVEGRLKKWKWILPKQSFKGRMLIINNLVSSMLWHRLVCMDPPTNLLSSGTICTGSHRASSSCPKRRADMALSTWRAEGLLSGSRSSKDSWLDLWTWFSLTSMILFLVLNLFLSLDMKVFC